MDLLDRNNKHIFLEKANLSNNSFIANVNTLVDSIETLSNINERFTDEQIEILNNLSGVEVQGLLENLKEDLEKGTYNGHRKLDMELALNLKTSTQVYYNKIRVVLDNEGYIDYLMSRQEASTVVNAVNNESTTTYVTKSYDFHTSTELQQRMADLISIIYNKTHITTNNVTTFTPITTSQTYTGTYGTITVTPSSASSQGKTDLACHLENTTATVAVSDTNSNDNLCRIYDTIFSSALDSSPIREIRLYYNMTNLVRIENSDSSTSTTISASQIDITSLVNDTDNVSNGYISYTWNDTTSSIDCIAFDSQAILKAANELMGGNAADILETYQSYTTTTTNNKDYVAGVKNALANMTVSASYNENNITSGSITCITTTGSESSVLTLNIPKPLTVSDINVDSNGYLNITYEGTVTSA